MEAGIRNTIDVRIDEKTNKPKLLLNATFGRFNDRFFFLTFCSLLQREGVVVAF